jgi:hypothetical protein
MTLRKFLIAMAAWYLWFLAMLGGIFMAAGIVAFFKSPQVLDNITFGNPPDRTSPGFWIGIALIAPCMLLNAAGALVLIVLPIYTSFHIPMKNMLRKDRKCKVPKWLEVYVESLNKLISRIKENTNE